MVMQNWFIYKRRGVLIVLTSLVFWCGEAVLFAAMTTGVFGGFTNHISEQIRKDKAEFAAAETCTIWHYEKLKKKPTVRPDVENISLPTIDQGVEGSPCPKEYADGIIGARDAFAQTQSFLSLSLTFFQFALVGDRNDDGEYDAVELQDVSESLGVNFLKQEEGIQLLAKLNGKFDAVRKTAEFSVLTDGMQVLFEKGYRLTPADQDALNQVASQQQF
ncbi:hypothetical protein [Candidatus Nitronereus thalassa]|uniref:EF-hand domain-containing protein n=1 Tax=Candidatus Nitronereus thalassa TaxID=3020898 RepID=A0ABU3K7V9_9BACT|nr:hypothetical protein [Candidatus Nitronereus thalassa]MDT7042468.1 hypothetical protein [Candidatus Nitronereus thalassa]